MKKQIISLEFAANMFGKLKPEIKEKLQAVIDNPCQDTWDDAYSIIINSTGRMKTLWNAIHTVRPDFCISKPLNSQWKEIPTSEEIVQAIKNVVFINESKTKIN